MSDEVNNEISLNGWQTVQLDDVCEIRGKTVNPEMFAEACYIGLEHIDSGESKLKRFGKGSEVRSSKSRFYKGDVLYGKLRPYLDKSIFAEIDGICSTDILVFKPKNQLDSSFLSHRVHQFDFMNHAVKNTSGVNHPRTSWAALKQFKFLLPPLSEQKAIAKVLHSAQQAKEMRQIELNLEREHKNALMDYLFSKGTRSENLKQTEIGDIPESWKVVKVGELVEMKYGFQSSIPKTPPPNGVKIISTAEVKNEGRLDLTKIRTVEVPENQVASYCVAQNDILFNWRNSQEHVGKCAIVDYEPSEPTVYASFIIRLRTKPTVDFRFLHALLTNLRNQGLFFKLSRRAVNQANFNANELADIDAVLPSLEEQKEIAEVLQACDEKISALEKEITTLDEFFKAMLEELMSGRLSTLSLMV